MLNKLIKSKLKLGQADATDGKSEAGGNKDAVDAEFTEVDDNKDEPKENTK